MTIYFYTMNDMALYFKALSDPTRLEIIELLSKNKSLCACTLLEAFNITQPTLSYHMKNLCECGLVGKEKSGTWVHYSLVDKNIASILNLFQALMVNTQNKKDESLLCISEGDKA